MKRQQLGYRMDDLADENLSRATISKIERNEDGVSNKKINYYLNRLGTTKEKLISELSATEKRKNKNIKYLLEGVEAIIDQYGPDALSDSEICLQSIQIDSAHPQYAKKHYILGKVYRLKEKYDKAIEHLQKSAFNEYGHPNMRASAFNDLGLLAHQENDVQQALSYIDQGLNICTPEGKRKYIRFTLLTNKVLILEKLGQRNQANEILESLWSEYDQIEKAPTKCQIHYLQANIYIDNEQHDEAIKLLNKAIELARINKLDEMSLTLWSALGRIHIRLGEYETAEKLLTIVIKLGKNNRTIVRPLILLAATFIKQSKLEKAYKEIKLALQYAKRFNDSYKIIDAYVVLSDYFTAQKKYQEATVALNEALEKAQKHHYFERQYRILKRLAGIHQKIDRAKYEEALKAKHELEMILEERGYRIVKWIKNGDGEDIDGA
ncbi:MAG TPA: helix-turn-helix transcriptional regulator [Taishania sp.]|nr:helix-turn-helix transcriptional regulator [Taishania sp.]